MVRKLSVKSVYGPVKFAEGEAKRNLCIIGGVANAEISGDSNYGKWTAFSGDFFAVNMVTGEEFRGAKCFLPLPAQELLSAAIKAMGGKGDGVQFRFGIGVTPDTDKRNKSGYQYFVRNLDAPETAGVLTKLMEKTKLELKSEPKQLPAPTPAAGKAAKKK